MFAVHSSRHECVMARPRLLLTGGTGFIGLGLIDPLLARGWDITVLTRNPTDSVRVLGTKTRTVSDLHYLDDSPDFDAVINLAGEPIAARRWTNARKQALRDSRIAVTESILTHCEDHGVRPRVLVSGSAIGYYGDTGEAVVDESAAAGSGFSAQLCADWEAAANAFAPLGTRVCVVRTGLVMGAGGMLDQLRPLFRTGLGGRLGSGRQWMSWIDWRDMVALLLAALDGDDWSGPVNAVAPEPVRNDAFTQTLARVLRRPALLPVPSPLLRLATGTELADELLLASTRVRPAALERLGHEFVVTRLEDSLAHWLG